MKKNDFIFIGNGLFAAEVLNNLVHLRLIPLLIIAQNKKTKKEINSPVFNTALKNKLPLIQITKINQKIDFLKAKRAKVFIVADYGEKLSPSLLKIPQLGCLNLHPSLLPLYRGPSPIQSSILNGELKTGVTLIEMDEKIDHGPIIAQEKINLSSQDNYLSLLYKLSKLGANLLAKNLILYLENKIKPKPQNHKRATYSSFIKKEDGRINWRKEAMIIERQIRAFYPWPGSYTFWNNKLLKITEGKIYSNNFCLEPGRVFRTENQEIAVATSKKSLIINKLQLEGKKELPASEFIKGYPQIIGSILK